MKWAIESCEQARRKSNNLGLAMLAVDLCFFTIIWINAPWWCVLVALVYAIWAYATAREQVVLDIIVKFRQRMGDQS